MSKQTVSMIIPTYQRDELLEITLQIVANQTIFNDIEIIVLNDGLPGRTEDICKKYGVKYIFMGQRNLKDKLIWRSGIYTVNHGIKQATGDILIISAAEMYLLSNDCLEKLIKPLASDPMAICIPYGKDDNNGNILNIIKTTNKISQETWDKTHRLLTKLPFLVAIKREHCVTIGGYDEIFDSGRCYDDTDFMQRLCNYGCHYIQTEARTIHLYHSRKTKDKNNRSVEANKKLYEKRKDVIYGNIGHDWGLLK